MNKRLRIVHDDAATSPRNDDNIGTIAYKHPRYNLGEEEIDNGIDWLMDMLNLSDRSKERYWNTCSSEADIMKYLIARIKRSYIILPVYLYDHSGITISTSSFSCRWDSGQVGWIYVSKEDAKSQGWNKDWLKEHYNGSYLKAAEGILGGEIEIFDQYLRGDVYGFQLEEYKTCTCGEHSEWEEIDSCWGFYGSDPMKNGMSDHIDLDGVQILEPEY